MTANNKRKLRIQYTNPTTIDQKSVKASEKVFGSIVREKQNIKHPKQKRKGSS